MCTKEGGGGVSPEHLRDLVHGGMRPDPDAENLPYCVGRSGVSHTGCFAASVSVVLCP
jgi:hypothetical protein